MFDLGDTVPLSVDIRNDSEVLTGASTVVLTIELPDGTTTTPSVTNPSTGRYQADYVPAAAGRYLARWQSTGPATAFVDSFDVRPASPAHILSLADAKQHLNITTTEHDEELRGWIEVTTDVVETITGRTIVRRAVTERHLLPTPTRELGLLHSPPVSLTSVTSLDGLAGAWDVAGFDLDTDAAVLRALPSTQSLYGLVRIVFVAGYPVLPAYLAGGAKMILRHLWESQRSGVGSKTAGRGQLLTRANQLADQFDGSTVFISGYAVPRAAAEVLGPRHVLL